MRGSISAPADACVDAGTTLNAVVRFYLAITRHQNSAAYGCLDAGQRQAVTPAAFAAAYTHTVATHLDLVISHSTGDNPNADTRPLVGVNLRGVDRAGVGLTQTRYNGQWAVTPDGHVGQPTISLIGGQAVTANAPTAVTKALDANSLFALGVDHRDVTGDGIIDDIYDVSGKGCASCHGQYLYIFERGVLIFAESNSDINWTHGSHGVMTIKAGRDIDGYHTETWRWTPFGFALQMPCVVTRLDDTNSNLILTPMDAYLPGSKRTSVVTLRTRQDVDNQGILSAMGATYSKLGYVGGCGETVTLPGSPQTTIYLQTDIFTGRTGGAGAYKAEGNMVWQGMTAMSTPALTVDPMYNRSGEATAFLDPNDKDKNNRGAWLTAHLRQGEVVITELLYTPTTNADTLQKLTSDFEYGEPAVVTQLRTLSADWYSCTGSGC